MTDKTGTADPQPVDFPPVPRPVTADRIVELMIIPRPDPRDRTKLHVKFRPILASADSRVPGVKFRPDTDDLFVMEGGMTLFNLYLDEYGPYRFVKKGITLSSSIPEKYRKYYFGWRKPLSGTHVAFLAKHIPGGKALRHPVLLFFEDPDNPHALSGPIDPDILNPGDHPTLTSVRRDRT